jgi:hypothetical protein
MVISFDAKKSFKSPTTKTITQAGCISPEKMSDKKRDNFSILLYSYQDCLDYSLMLKTIKYLIFKSFESYNTYIDREI